MNNKKIAKYTLSAFASAIVAAAVVCAAVSCSNSNKSATTSNSKNQNNDVTTLSVNNATANSNDNYHIAYGKNVTFFYGSSTFHRTIFGGLLSIFTFIN